MSFGEKMALDLLVAEDAPRAAQVIVVAQDVNLILGDVEPVLEEGLERGEAESDAANFRPRRLGSVVTLRSKDGGPLTLQAIVYDFEKAPPVEESHVFEALVTAFEEARSRGLARLAVRPIGTAHAGLRPAAFLKLLTQVCYSSAEMGTTLRRIFLLIPSPDEMARYQGLLRELIEAEEAKDL